MQQSAYAQHMPNTNAPEQSRPSRRARLFRNGRNQAVRIPREFEIAADSVTIYRDENRLVIEPVERSPSLAEVLSGLVPLDEDFGPIADPLTEPEEIF